MKMFFSKNKTLLLSVAGAIFAMILAVVIALAIADGAKNVFYAESNFSSICQNDVSIPTIESSPIEDVSSEPEIVVDPLVITSPSQNDVSVSESYFAIAGTSDPNVPLTMNGIEIERLENGAFSLDVELAPGNNTFKFEYNGETFTYIIRYNFTIIKAYAPYEKQSYEAGSSFVVVALARIDCSSVTASFNGKTINLTRQAYKEGEEFANYTGSFSLPTGNESDVNLGVVKFTATCKGASRSYSSPSITCLRDKALDGTQVVEIVASQAETFNGNTTDDWSRPTNSYLPAGTLDYKVGGIVYEPESGNSYYNLRCGKRVYINKKNPPDTERVTVSKVYKGELPENNDISLSTNTISGRHTILCFDTAWRAPFAVDVGPQNYTNPAKQDYTISDVSFDYVDIKFFYTNTIGGDFVFENHPLFSSAQLLQGTDGYVLRLYLNETGAFYGWNASYNAEGQLVFEFLNPPTVTKKDDLTGIKIVIDAGHGGRDIGAPGIDPNRYPEAERNLSLAYKLKKQLEKLGATVVMTRTSDVELSSDARCEFLRREAPDLCISIHHDSSTRSSANGAGFFCFNAFSDKAVQYVYDQSVKGNFYSKTQKSWHYFYLARVTSCPVVLTENGFISNPQDFIGISNDSVNTQKAQAIANGVLDYFNSFYKNVANEDDNSYNGDDYGPNGQPSESHPDTPPDIEDAIVPDEEYYNTGDEDEKQ